MSAYDLLKLVEYGGCSAKLAAKDLESALQGLSGGTHPNLLVGSETHDDGGVYKINEETALILTTDFFPPLCSDPYEFGQIAAANALSDVYAMGGEVLSALNLVMFPVDAPLEVLREIIRGGNDKVLESGGIVAGGHTIVDTVPKYGLAVTGQVHPQKVITNAGAKPGDVLILTKPIGAGLILAGHRLGEAWPEEVSEVFSKMKQLNKTGATLMQRYQVKCATDVTGFGLAGHALKLAKASGVTLEIETDKVPLFEGAYRLAEMGCIPGACFRNLEYADPNVRFPSELNYEMKMMMFDAQTSGGLLICCPEPVSLSLLDDLKQSGYAQAAYIGKVKESSGALIEFQS